MGSSPIVSTMRVMPRLLCAMAVVATIAVARPISASAAGDPKPSTQEAVFRKMATSDLRDIGQRYGRVRQPDLPAGFHLVHASSGGLGIDLWWHRVRDDATVHVWQTHDADGQLGDKDPTNPSNGSPITIAGDPWLHVTINACEATTCLSRRFPNGDVVELSGSLPADQMQRVASKF